MILKSVLVDLKSIRILKGAVKTHVLLFKVIKHNISSIYGTLHFHIVVKVASEKMWQDIITRHISVAILPSLIKVNYGNAVTVCRRD
jgi:hypothetical protein